MVLWHGRGMLLANWIRLALDMQVSLDFLLLHLVYVHIISVCETRPYGRGSNRGIA